MMRESRHRPPGGPPVPVWIDGVGHRRVGVGVGEEAARHVHDEVLIRADEPTVPACTASGRSVVSRMTSTGLPRLGASS